MYKRQALSCAFAIGSFVISFTNASETPATRVIKNNARQFFKNLFFIHHASSFLRIPNAFGTVIFSIRGTTRFEIIIA